MLRIALIAAAAVSIGSPASAQQQRDKVAVDLAGSLAGTSGSGMLAVVETALAGRPDVALIPKKRIRALLRRARKPQLAACEGEIKCLAEMAGVVGARWVIAVEVGGLGDVQLLHLKLIDARKKRAVRSTTAELASGALEPGALVRLLTPRSYRGRLSLAINAAGAQVFIDGRRVATAPVAKPITLSVGTHALRITHPEFRDYVRFVDVAYDEEIDLDVGMKPLSVVSSDMTATGGRTTPGDRRRPWYGRWYVIAGIGAAVLAGSITIWAVTAGGLDFDREREL